MKTYKLVIASDHNGVKLKDKIISHFSKIFSIKDFGANDSQLSVDYPDYASKVVDAMSEGVASLGILICATGIGMSIAANRNSNIRAALCTNLLMAERARMHNDANIIVLGSMVTEENAAIAIVEHFLTKNFEGGRHIKRLNKIH